LISLIPAKYNSAKQQLYQLVSANKATLAILALTFGGFAMSNFPSGGTRRSLPIVASSKT
jgi:hypothetical protein